MMKYNNLKYTILLTLFACTTLTACIDDDFVDLCEKDVNGIPEGFKDGYSLNLTVTLDNMGGSTTRAATPANLKYWEDYIDPEKFRVLFFDNKDRFLFESKSRWVKKLNENDNSWLVSVPVFTYGNDFYEEGEWPWEDIRDALTGKNGEDYFKIAILANRPELEWYPGKLKNTENDVPRWIDNTGPHWTPNNSRSKTEGKTVFDLHHCQYDPIYHGKATNNGYYDFIMGNWGNTWTVGNYATIEPEMGATSSWLDWTTTNERNYQNTDNKTPLLTYIHPDATHPIPMYGIQRFETIKGWEKGTPFNLSKDIPGGDDYNSTYKKQTIWLLRSVVKLELLIPKKVGNKEIAQPKYVAMCYPNIYARCEPMDVWTSTDSLWNKQHENDNEKCEIKYIMNYGPVVNKNGVNSSDAFKTKMSWFYGVWKKEKGWKFNENGGNPIKTIADEKPNAAYPTPYPRIFNSCIQRNSVVVCEKAKTCLNDIYPEEYGDDYPYWHYVVYTGERDINDPSSLPRIDRIDGGYATAQYWVYEMENKLYGLPIADYSVPGNPAIDRAKTPNNNNYNDNQPDNYADSMNGNYLTDVANLTEQSDRDKLPWPLVRNHVYRLTLSGVTNPVDVIKKWDFTNLSAQTRLALDSDTENWENTNGYWKNITDIDPNSYLKANSQVIAETNGLYFNVPRQNGIQFYIDKLHLIGNTTITIQNVKKGQSITIVGRSADNMASDRGIAPVNDNYLEYTGNQKWVGTINGKNYCIFYGSKTDQGIGGDYEFTWKVKDNAPDNVDVKFELSPSGGGYISFMSIRIEEPRKQNAPKKVSETNNGLDFVIKSEDLHTKKFKK